MTPASDLPRTSRDWLLRAGDFLDRGYLENARLALRQSDAMAPDEATFFRGLAAGYRAAGMAQEAAVAEMAALAYEQQSPAMLYNLATSYLMTQRPIPAERWYRACLRMAPGMVAAHQNLASIMELDGRHEYARHHRDQAYGRQSMFIDESESSELTVLILCTAATGNVPYDWLLPQDRYRRIRWVMEYATEAQFAALPEFDCIFNAIGDADVSSASQQAVQRLLAMTSRPVINMPQIVERTSREAMAGRLRDISNIVVPQALRLERAYAPGELAKHLSEQHITPPLLLRPRASHGGKGLVLHENDSSLATAGCDAGWHASAFHDARSADGHWRKYRVIFVGGKPYPYHLAIADRWLVHYRSADMLSQQWKRDEEWRFLRHPAAVLGWSAMQALRRIAKSVELDFWGIDFALLEDGRLLVFEANATMLVHREEFHAELAYRNPFVQKILDAFSELVRARTSRSMDGPRALRRAG
jgi:hypothetical protein